ncbi:DUF1559 domain-containing protein [uncultured Gimesia sp.]|uniref:DUF1559 family PulG-like putative transporter n=1 Tax=uncultured Gimesia sp. TaxID=1678688 RepID=UPI002607F8BC|nr:DUF1559 domain-containing protein [uncultured Gimesia sp.]
MEDYKQVHPPENNNTTTHWITPAITIGGVIIVILMLVVLILPVVQQARETSGAPKSKNNMKQIGLALHNYHDKHSIFPPGAIETTDGRPYHSWQTSILPFVDQNSLYNQINFNKAWHDPANQMIFQQKIRVYLNPSIQETAPVNGYEISHYRGNELVLKKNNGFRIVDIKDSTPNTIMAMEIGENFKPWGDPTNITNPPNIIGSGKKTTYKGGYQVLMADGSVRFISEDVDRAVLKALSTPDGGEVLGEF